MKNKFNKKYYHLLYEFKGDILFDIQKYKEFLNTAIKINEFGKIINEEKQDLIDIPNQLIQYLLTNENKLIKAENFKFHLKSSKHWKNLKNLEFNNIFFGLFNFNQDEDIDKFHYTCFNIPKEYLEQVRNEFKLKVQSSFGFFNHYENIDVICINTNSTDIFLTLNHELSHFIQQYGNIRIINGITEEDIQNKNLLKNIFNVDYDTVITYFSNTEFIPHVDDLILMLQKTKQKFHLSDQELLDNIRSFLLVENRLEMLTHDFLNKFKEANKNNVDCLYMLLFSYISKYRFQSIFNHIKSRF